MNVLQQFSDFIHKCGKWNHGERLDKAEHLFDTCLWGFKNKLCNGHAYLRFYSLCWAGIVIV